MLKYSGVTISADNIPSFEFSANGLSAEVSHNTKVFQSIVINKGVSKQTIKLLSNIHAGLCASFATRLKGELGPDQMPKIPLQGCPLANLYVSAGPYLKAEVEVAADFSYDRYLTLGLVVEQDLRDKSIQVIKRQVSDNNKEPLSLKKLLLSGKLGYGVFFEVGIALPYYKVPKAKVALRGKAYVEAEGSYMIHDDDLEKAGSETIMYENLRKTVINLNLKAEYDLIFRKLTFNILSLSGKLESFDLVPKFEIAGYCRNGTKRLWVTANVNSNLLFDSDMDFIAKNADNEIISTRNTIVRGIQNHEIEFELDNIGKGEFEVYPRCTFMGITMLASPSQRILFIDSNIGKVENLDARYSYEKGMNAFRIQPTYDMPSYGLNDEYDEIFVLRNVDKNDDYARGQYKNGNSFLFSVPDGHEKLSLDYSDYVAKMPISMSIIKWFKIGESDKWSYVATDFHYHTYVYDKKPSVTFSNVYAIGTSVIEISKNGNIYYKTDYKYTNDWQGVFWMKCWQWETSNGWYFDSTGTQYTNWRYNDYYTDGTWDDESYHKWWSDNKIKDCTNHKNIILRNGTTLKSNYIYFNQGNVSVMAAGKGISPKTVQSPDRKNFVVVKENSMARQGTEFEMTRSNSEFDDIAKQYLRR